LLELVGEVVYYPCRECWKFSSEDAVEKISSKDADYNLWLLLLKVRRAIFKAREKELHRFGITPEQAGVLYIILETNGKATRSEMSRLMVRELHTVYGIVDRMEKKGLVRKVRDTDRKSIN